MTWAQIYPLIRNWPGGGTPPIFDIGADVNGSAVIELAWDPQAMMSPGSYPEPQQLRYYASDVDFSASVARASGGGNLSISVPKQNITITGNRGTWMIPESLWAGYREESLKSVGSPVATTFSGNLYYRVRVYPTGSPTATVWPSDMRLSGPYGRDAPSIGILPISGDPLGQVGLDMPAVAGLSLPFLPAVLPNLLTSLWNSLPPGDRNRKSLAEVMAHEAYVGLPVAERSRILMLWLFSHNSRTKIPALLERRAVTGSGVTTPIVSKVAEKGGRNLVSLLLDLLFITPHPDLGPLVREQLVADVLTEILDPNGQVNQGGTGTCLPTSVQAMLIAVNPAEYVRLQVGWLSSAGQAELADGSVADVPPGIFQVSRYNTAGAPTGNTDNVSFIFRTFSEMAFQGAVLKFAQNARFPAFDGTEASLQVIFKHVYAGGLSLDEGKRCLEAIFATTFTSSGAASPPGTAGLAIVQTPMEIGLVVAMKTKQQPILLVTYWATPPRVAPGPYAAHAVVALRYENGHVIFKNPQYAGSSPVPGAANGGNDVNPPRRYEDVSQALESMSDADLTQWIYGYLAPDTAII